MQGKPVRWEITNTVASMVCKPEFLGDGMPVKTHGVAYATCNHFHVGAIGVVAPQLRVGLAGQADVARCAKRNVYLVVGTKADVLPVVVLLRRQVELGRQVNWFNVRVLLNVIVAQHLVDRHDVERALVHGHGGLDQRVHHHTASALLAVVGDFVNAAQGTGTYVNFSTFTARHSPIAGRAVRPNFRFEAGCQLQVLDWNVGRRRSRQLARVGRER